MNNINLMINSMIEYIEIMISIALNKNLKNYVEELDNLKEQIYNINTIEEVNKYREIIREYDIKINEEKRQLTSREQALVERGYNEEDVLRLSSFNNQDVEEKKRIIIERITKDCNRTRNPICIYVGGQPGCGKSTISRKLRSQTSTNGLVDISLDNYRSYHPHYLEIEECIKNHWENRVETANDTKGNDIADFTHNFASVMSDTVLDDVSKVVNGKSYNIVLEWGMRTPEAPLERMRDLKSKGYTNVVDFILVHKDISKEACKIRADIMNNFSHILRRVPDYFHDICTSTLPASAKTIYQIGYEKEGIIDKMMLSSRDNRIIWDNNDKEDIEEIYRDYIENKELSQNYKNSTELAMKSYTDEEKGFKSEIDEMFKTAESKSSSNKFTFH